MQKLPLKGISIISFEHFGAAPYATLFLADMGAEVIKAETEDGDFARQTGPLTLGPHDSLYFQTFNMNKKSVFLDVKTPKGVEFLKRLVKDSDAVVNNLRGNLPEKYGLDYKSLKDVNPAIVCGHISAYGRHGSRAAWPGFDFLMQAEAGLMSLNSEAGAVPTRIGASMIDYMTGMMLAFGVVSAILSAKSTGEGCDVDVSLFDAAAHQLAYQGSWYLNEKIVTTGLPRSAHPTTTPVQVFKTGDGWIFLACMNEKFWRLLTMVIGRSELSDDPRFRGLEQRLANRDALTAILDQVFEAKPTAHWLSLLQGQVPVAPVHNLGEALENRFLVDEVGLIQEVGHAAGPIKVLANPLMINGRRVPRRAAPQLGEHTGDLGGEVQQHAEKEAPPRRGKLGAAGF